VKPFYFYIMQTYDLIICGAGTAGCSAAITAGRAGLKTLVLERLSKAKTGDKTCGDCMREVDIQWILEELDTDITPVVLKRNLGVQLMDEHRRIVRKIPGSLAKKITIDRHAHGQLLLNKALSYSCVEFKDHVLGSELIIEGNLVKGLRCDQGEFYSSVLLDCTGVQGPFRKQLKQTLPALDLDLPPDDKAFAVREVFNYGHRDIAELQNDVIAVFEKTRTDGGYIWYFPLGEAQVNAGIGGNAMPAKPWFGILRQDYSAMGIQNKFPQKSSGAFLPARSFSWRPVASGYIAAGDAAFAVSAIDGSGIQASMISAKLAVLQALKGIQSGDCSEAALWPYTHAFFNYDKKGINNLHGASVSSLEALKPALQSLSSLEFGFLLSSIHERFLEDIYTLSYKNIHAVLFSLLRLSLRPAMLQRLILGGLKSYRLKKLYLQYPIHQKDYPAWLKKAQRYFPNRGLI
jgi:flavin-dependent dehydrogenase